jgi:hypothetical protein
MTTFCLQIQPDRAPGLDMDRVRSLCRLVTSRRALARNHSIVDGTDKGQHLNFIFETGQPAEFWALLQSVFYEDTLIGPAMARASLALCEGDQGWDDCLVLHHFDPEVETDTL